MSRRAVVTGGAGFIGAYLVKRLVRDGWSVGVVDTMVRGSQSRLSDVEDEIELFTADVRDEAAMTAAVKGADVVFHLAAINGTENFYTRPELVLDVGIRGAIAAVNGCRTAGVPDLVVASTAEVYQTPSVVPTPEDIPLMLPNSINPRYSYGGSKIASELIAMNYGKDHFRQLQIFRPHNVYGPDMGWKHVLPQFLLRAAAALEASGGAAAAFPIQGDGSETRAFCYADDIVDGIMTMYENGGHREIYHIGNDEEISIRRLVEVVGETLGGDLDIQPGPATEGGTPRRCPDISKMRAIGYEPKVKLADGVKRTADWYMEHRQLTPENELL
ncbi:MAG: SDR family NAD(P)-dependent oxidoreductase [Rhodobacter sp.]|nr:SDR family NAD(P)-dependent oxidoreductase [Rhodobacter sp.]